MASRKDGSEFPTEISLSPDERPDGVMPVAIPDLTQQVQLERDHREAEAMYRSLFESVPDGLYIVNHKGEFLDANREAERLVGYPREELLGTSFLETDLLSVEDLQRAAKNLQDSIKGLPTGPDEFTLRRKDGTQVPVEIRTYPTEIEGQRVVLGSARDITERKRLEVALRVSEAGLRAAQRLAHIGSADSDLVAQTHAISDELFRIYGIDADEYWREPGVEKFLDQIHEEDRPWVAGVLEAARLEGQDYDIQYRLVHPDGDV